MFFEVLFGYAFHAIDLNVNIVSIGNRVRYLIDRLFVNLHTVDGQTRPGIQLFVADVTLEVFGLLVLNQNLLVIELAIAIPVPTNGDQSVPTSDRPPTSNTYQHHGLEGFFFLRPIISERFKSD